MKKYLTKKQQINRYYFFRSAKITAAVIIPIIILFFGFSEAYCQIRRICFGEYVTAVELLDGGIRILDFIITF